MNLHTDTTVIIPFLFLMYLSVTHLLHWNLTGGSDHFPVILKTSLRDDEPAAEHWKFDRADWMSFRTLCVSRLSDELALSEDPVARFTDTLIEIENQTIPKSRMSKSKLPKVPWFNDVVNKLLKNVRKLNGNFFATLLQKMYLLLKN